MLEKLTIRNFQRHRKFSVEFAPGVTTLLGRSDAGKSAVLRALRWVMTNQPNGTAFVTHGEDACRVTLWADGHKVVRERGESNSYTLDGRVFKALGAGGVPDDIAKLFDVGEVNFQTQLAAPFWLSLSPGQVSQEINAVVSLEEIDRTLAAANAEVKRARGKAAECKERIERHRKRADSLAWVADADARLRALEERAADIASRRARIAAGESLLKEAREAVRRRQDAAARLKRAETVLAVGERYLKAVERRDAMASLVREGKELWRKREALESSLKSISARLEELTKDGCPLCGSPASS